MPAVSVIIPVFNVEPYIAQCARSLFGQTLEDMEFLFIDDSSQDRSIELIQQILETEFPARKAQVQCFRMPVNSGQAVVRMFGIAHATGDYVIQCDGDDFVDPVAYSLLYETALSGQYDIVSCNLRCGSGDAWTVKLQHPTPGQEKEDILLGRISYSLCTKLIRRSLLDKLRAPVSNVGEDMVISVQAFLKGKRFCHLPEALYSYRTNPASTSREAGDEALLRRLEASQQNVHLLLTLLQQEYGYSPSSPEVVYTKYNGRHWLEPVVHLPRFYHLWKATYPEINRRFLFTPKIAWQTKFWFLLIVLRLYRPVKQFTQTCRRACPRRHRS